ncbi:hypothetical protein [Arthrobacter pityocampae]|uniref:hypothetical protein n=1 Tax=Arthrobacter pityocampae TaxID=547334 RepID=UPI0037350A38
MDAVLKALEGPAGAGLVMMLCAFAAFRGRKVIGRAQAQALVSSFNVGADRQSEIAAGLANAWFALSVLVLAGGLVIVAAGLITL